MFADAILLETSVGDVGVYVKAVVTSACARTTAPVLPSKELTPATEPVTAVCTNSVVASCVVLVNAAAVGADGTPTNIGDIKLAGTYVSAVVTSPEVSEIGPILVLKDITLGATAVNNWPTYAVCVTIPPVTVWLTIIKSDGLTLTALGNCDILIFILYFFNNQQR